ncbi:transforming acidic coiled-coil-containing protein 3-like [Dendronephthya gigantea]|uniref:transforming acidic coiled-coil-containing protein 3-like n=1 Tax=Dendronephthya gigantea TaxID=151771 RepID=UPI00106D265E|nr:transforming acidic coiled-coil-containing protein 3-like [Dendronephthya gigantea]
MEKLPTIGKENLFDALNCSPISPSGCELRQKTTEKLVYSPLSERNLVLQDNSLRSPEAHRSSKAGLFLSTPVEKTPDLLPEDLPDWEEIRRLDEDELWIERTQVVTKEDHLFNIEIAKEVVNDIIENLPIASMDDSTAECDNTVVEVNLLKDDLTNGFDDMKISEKIEEIQNGGDFVCDEKQGNVAIDMKDVVQNNEAVSSSDEPVIQSHGQEDNDFIHSCSDLDTTVKEISANDVSCLENTISEDISLEDLDETVKEVTPDEQASSALTTQSEDDYANFEFDESSFKPAAEFGLELDFLENIGTTGADHESDLARQSLYVKFDPLVEARKPKEAEQEPGALANINPADLLFKGSIANDDLLCMDTPPEKPVISRRALLAQTENAETGESTAVAAIQPVDLLEISPSKDIPAAEKPEEEEASKSVDSTLPAKEESPLVQPLQFSKTDLDKAVEEEKNKLLSQWNLQKSLHEADLEKLLDERNEILEERNKLLDENKVVKTLMMEYEQTMAQMIKDRESEKSQQERSNSEIVNERDQLQRDLHNTEKSFAHLHEKFGKLKTAVESYRKNEDVLKKVVKDLQEDVKNSEAKYQVLKGHAEQKLQEANVEINRVQTTFKTELAGLQAAFKREKTKVSSLQQTLDQKINENKELTAICDELISKVGPMP